MVKRKTRSKSSDSSQLSADYMWNVLDRLKNSQTRKSTKHNYLQIWKQFNNFLIRLDKKPKIWENRVSLFCAFLIDNGTKSTTIRSYVSAIKHILKMDGYDWDDSLILLSSLTRACKLINDTVFHHLPISRNMLEVLLFEIERLYASQTYLEILYKTILLVGYYGMFRVGELASYTDKVHSMDHSIKAKNVHIGKNKDKIMFVLYSSKTHAKESPPQKVKMWPITCSLKPLQVQRLKDLWDIFALLNYLLSI